MEPKWSEYSWNTKTKIPTTTTLSKWVNAFSEAETKGATKDSICPVSSKRFKQTDQECSDSSESIRSSELQKSSGFLTAIDPNQIYLVLSPNFKPKGLRHESEALLELSPRQLSQSLAVPGSSLPSGSFVPDATDVSCLACDVGIGHNIL